MHPTHRTWRWYYKKETDNLQRIKKRSLYHYHPARTIRTRSLAIYDLEWKEEFNGQNLRKPTFVTTSVPEATVEKQKDGADLAVGPSEPSDFWEFLNAWGGKWMCVGIDDDQPIKHVLKWAVKGMKNNTLIWMTDSLYN